METFEQEIDYEKIEAAQLSISEAKTIEDLATIYKKMERAVKGNKAIIAAKDAKKKELSV